MKKRMVATVLAAVMAMSLAACGSSDSSSSSEPAADAAATEAAADDTAEETADEEADYSDYTIRIYSNSNSTERTTWLINEAKDAGFSISIDDNSVISGDTAAVQAANEKKDGDLIFGLNETRWSQIVNGVYASHALQVRVEGDEIVVTAKAYAKAVEILNDREDLVLTDNYFDMNAGEKRVRVLRKGLYGEMNVSPLDPATLRVRSVYDIGR